jgi:ABC-type phosphate/phosphonate transport system substrate-binding protein
MMNMRIVQVSTFLALILAAPVAFAKDLVLTSPPRESEEKARQIFLPIADYLTRTLGRPVVYKYSDNWLTYQSEMQKDIYDIVFDGPHFVSYRMARYQHTPVVKLPGKFVFVVIARKNDEHTNKLEDINGRRLCAPAPPNLAALTALAQYTNPARQPILIDTKGFPQAYEALLSGKCVAAAIQIKVLEKLDNEKKAAKILFESKSLPNQAITASPRLDPALRARLAEALLSDAGKQATAKLREEYNGQDFVPATAQEYEGHQLLLKDVWGFQI